MKTYFIWLLLCIPMLTGCITDNLDDCPDDENGILILEFEYFNVGNKDLYDDRIDLIDVAIFDESSQLYALYTHPAENILHRRVQYKLPEGIYNIVCWANNTSDRNSLPVVSRESASTYEETLLMDNLFVNNTGSDAVGVLYYAPEYREDARAGIASSVNRDARYRTEVIANRTVIKRMPFMAAFRTINVLIKGLRNLDDSGIEKPTAGITNLAAYYNYHLELSPEDNCVDFSKRTVKAVMDEIDYAHAVFYVPHFAGANNMIVTVSGNGEQAWFSDSVRLEDFLSENDITVWDGDEKELSICFEYLDGVLVDVSLINWRTEYIRPGFDKDDDQDDDDDNDDE